MISYKKYTWRFRGRNIQATFGRVRGEIKGKFGMVAKEKLVWVEASTLAMVLEIQVLHGRS